MHQENTCEEQELSMSRTAEVRRNNDSADTRPQLLYYKIRVHTNLIKKYPDFEQSYLLKKSRRKNDSPTEWNGRSGSIFFSNV